MTSVSKPARPGNIDGHPGLASGFVLLTLMWVFFGMAAPSYSVGSHLIVLVNISAVGHVSVNLFLVITGFLLAGPFVNGSGARARYSFAGLFERRVRRIVPPYCLLLFVAVEKPRLRWIQRGSRNARARSTAPEFLKPVIA